MSEYQKGRTSGYQAGDEKASDKQGECEKTYERLTTFREPYLARARECALLTIPALIPPNNWTGTEKLYTPFQGIGARGVNNLASKLLLALFPPNTPLFRLRIEEAVKAQMQAAEPKVAAKIEEGLASIERNVAAEIETQALRPSLFEGLKHLIVAGNVLFFFPPKGGVRVFHLDRYCVRRDPSGNVLEILVKEEVSPASLKGGFYKQIQDHLIGDNAPSEPTDMTGDDKTVSLFTHIKLNEAPETGRKWWTIYQEVKGLKVPDSDGTYPFDKSPWLALRWTKIDGEDYGRGYCEEYLGDLQSLEGLSQSIVEGSAAAAKVVFLVNPNGITKIKDLAESANGGFKAGNALDVTVLHVEKQNDFRVARESADGIEKRLSFAFMLNTSVQRQGERVTAEEIRYMVQEIEDGLGGIYSVFSQELQLPLVKILMFRMEKAHKLPVLPKGKVTPTIVTGIEALGRGHDLQKLRAFLGEAIQILGPEIAARYLNVDDYLTRLATAAGIDSKGLIKTADEMALADQQAQQQAMIAQLGPDAIKAGSGLMQAGMKDPANAAAMKESFAQATGGNKNRVFPAQAAAARSAAGAMPRPGTPSAG